MFPANVSVATHSTMVDMASGCASNAAQSAWRVGKSCFGRPFKQRLMGLTVLSVAVSAWADVDVAAGLKMYGVLDQGVVHQTLTSPNTGIQAEYSGIAAVSATSRLGFKGSRPLSEGLAGIFQFEIQLDADAATLLPAKNRTAFVGLQSDTLGTVQVGTIETAGYEVYGTDVNTRVEYKPNVWRTVTSLDLQDRTNNSIKYISPAFNGFEFHLQQSFSEQPSTTAAYGTTANTFAELTSVAVKYKASALKATVVHDETKNALMGYKFAGLSNAGISTTATTDYALYYAMPSTASAANTTLAISTPIQRDFLTMSYDFGPCLVHYLYAKSYQTGSYAGSNTTHTLGAKVLFEKFTVGLSVGAGSVKSYTGSTAVSSSSNTTATTPSGRAKDGKLSDVTVGIYYNFDNASSAYVIGSDSASNVGVNDGASKTVAIGIRYNF